MVVFMKPNIGIRWVPGSVVRRDTGTGFFEHVNPTDLSTDALRVQWALLYQPAKRKFSRPGFALLAYLFIVGVAALCVAAVVLI